MAIESPRETTLPVLLGLAAAAAKVVYSFVPFFNVVDAALFLALGLWLGRRGHPARHAAVLAAPAVLLALYFAWRVGARAMLDDGVGAGWAVSAVLIPLAALAGVHLGRRAASRARPA